MVSTKIKRKYYSVKSLDKLQIPAANFIPTKVDPSIIKSNIEMLGVDQRTAHDEILEFVLSRYTKEYDMFLLTGAAGTGKSTCVNTLIHTLFNKAYESECSMKIAVAGMTHAAKDVLSYTSPIELPASEKQERLKYAAGLVKDSWDEDVNDDIKLIKYTTAHSLLNYRQQRTGLGINDVKFVKDKYGTNDITDFDLVIVDEASMNDDMIFKDLYKHRKDVCIVFVGDVNQLPPVNKRGIATVFKAKAQQAYKIKLCNLNQIFRQAANSPIIQVSQEILNTRNIATSNVKDKENAVIWVNPNTLDKKSITLDWIAKQYDSDYPKKFKVLAYTNKTVNAYNNAIRQRIFNNPRDLEPNEYVNLIGAYQIWIKDFKYKPVYYNRQQLKIVSYTEELVTSKQVDFLIKPIPYLKAKVLDSRGNTGVVPLLCDLCENSLVDNINSVIWNLERYKADDPKNKQQRYYWYVNLQRLYNLIVPFHFSYAGTTHTAQGDSYTSIFIDWDDLETCRYMDSKSYKSLLYTCITRARNSAVISPISLVNA